MLPEVSKKPSASPPSSKPLRRGRACVNCRFLKIKCDGVKPVCGPCLRHPKEDECDYTDVQGRSRTKVLEETIFRLENRVRELEHPGELTPSVTLHDPYSHYYQSQQYPLSSSDSPSYDSSTPFSPTSTTSSPPLGSSEGSSTSSTHPDTGVSFLGNEEPPLLVIRNLLDNFLPYTSQFGFFLDVTRFHHSALLVLPFGHPSRPSPALLSTVYLWGVHLSQSEPLISHHDVFLSRALKYTATDISNLTMFPERVLHTVQAEVLLSNYFLRNGHFLEAKCHSALAVSLVLGCGFNRIRSSHPVPRSTIGVVVNTVISPQPPANAVEEGERINGFWTVFMLHKTLAVSLDSPSNLCGALEAPGVQIDTPWPLDIESYKAGLLPPGLQGSSTVRDFLSELPGNTGTQFSTAALNVKGAILLHRAAHLSGQWAPNMQQRESHAFSSAFASLDRLITGFRGNLPPVPGINNTNPSATRTLLVMHALAEGAAIKLHSNFAYVDPSSKQKSLAAARAMVSLGAINSHDIGFISPIMGTLWMAACQVFIDEISRIRAQQQGVWPPSIGGEDELLTALRDGMAAMTTFSGDSPLMKYQLSKIEEAYRVI